MVCYQGAVVADPMTGEWLRHVPMPRADALEAIDAVTRSGVPHQLLRRRQAVRRERDSRGAAYADFHHLAIHEVGDLHEWLQDDPTKLVAVGVPEELDALEDVLKPRFAGSSSSRSRSRTSSSSRIRT